MDIPSVKSKWVCGLSNGENLVEGKGVVSSVIGEDSPWWKLQAYLKEKGLTITSFGLWVGDKHYNLPSINPKFGGEVPTSYNCKRSVKMDTLIGSNTFEHYTCAEAIYPTYKIQIWVDENDENKMWVGVINHA